MLQYPTASVQSSTKFFLTVKGPEGCTDTSSVLIGIRPKTIFSVTYAHEVCKGQAVPLLVENGDEFSWTPATYLSNAATGNPVAIPDKSVQYSLHVKELTCSTDSTIAVDIHVNQLPVVSAGKFNDIDCTTSSSQLDVTGALTYLWSPASGLNNATLRNPVSTATTSTAYIVKGTDAKGCSAYDTVDVLVTRTGSATYDLPSAFTPNGDGNNDCFGIAKSRLGPQVEFSVFNRFGQRVYLSYSPTACWNGTYNGVLQDPGGYVYIIKAQSSCGVVFKKGTVLLLK